MIQAHCMLLCFLSFLFWFLFRLKLKLFLFERRTDTRRICAKCREINWITTNWNAKKRKQRGDRCLYRWTRGIWTISCVETLDVHIFHNLYTPLHGPSNHMRNVFELNSLSLSISFSLSLILCALARPCSYSRPISTTHKKNP